MATMWSRYRDLSAYLAREHSGKLQVRHLVHADLTGLFAKFFQLPPQFVVRCRTKWAKVKSFSRSCAKAGGVLASRIPVRPAEAVSDERRKVRRDSAVSERPSLGLGGASMLLLPRLENRRGP